MADCVNLGLAKASTSVLSAWLRKSSLVTDTKENTQALCLEENSKSSEKELQHVALQGGRPPGPPPLWGAK